MTTPSLEEVTKLVKDKGYSPSIIPKLEAYVDATAAGSVPYSMDCNRCLSKLYSMVGPTPDSGEAMYTKLLQLSMMQYPATDFLELCYLIPDKVQSAEPAAAVLRCASLLDDGKFSTFWKEYETLPTKMGDTKKLQGLILGVLALSYREAPTDVVKAAIGGEVSASFEVVESVNDSTVTFVATKDNTKRHRVFSKGITFPDITKMTQAAQ